MGEIAGRLAALPVLTCDNPRTEEPAQILTAVEQGLRQSGNDSWRTVPDRREAIVQATQAAAAGEGDWLVLVAGKGHEERQIVGERVIPFSDREELRAALAAEMVP
jgi:UDP-N-acetylmuramyl tripeptide synthase